jgi:hypothetical protein
MSTDDKKIKRGRQAEVIWDMSDVTEASFEDVMKFKKPERCKIKCALTMDIGLDALVCWVDEPDMLEALIDTSVPVSNLHKKLCCSFGECFLSNLWYKIYVRNTTEKPITIAVGQSNSPYLAFHIHASEYNVNSEVIYPGSEGMFHGHSLGVVDYRWRQPSDEGKVRIVTPASRLLVTLPERREVQMRVIVILEMIYVSKRSRSQRLRLYDLSKKAPAEKNKLVVEQEEEEDSRSQEEGCDGESR